MVFHNLKEIYIVAACHPFSLSKFLSIIQKTSLEKITINGEYAAMQRVTSSLEYTKIESKYKERQYEIEIDYPSLIISKCLN